MNEDIVRKMQEYSEIISTEFTEERYSLRSEKGEKLEGMFYELIEMQEQHLPAKIRRECDSLAKRILGKVEGLI